MARMGLAAVVLAAVLVAAVYRPRNITWAPPSSCWARPECGGGIGAHDRGDLGADPVVATAVELGHQSACGAERGAPRGGHPASGVSRRRRVAGFLRQRPDLPTNHAVASGEVTTFAGPDSVREVAVATDRARAYLTGLLVATTALAVVLVLRGVVRSARAATLAAAVLSVLVAVALLLRGRSFTDRAQATVLAGRR